MNVPESHTRHCAVKARAAHKVARRALGTLADRLDTERAESFYPHLIRHAVSNLECYCEITLAAKSTFAAEQETIASATLARLAALQHTAGRRDGDLVCAAHCLSRVNNRKLQDHARRARASLLQDSARLQYLVATLVSHVTIRETHRLQHVAPRRLAVVALLDFYSHTIELASHLDDVFTAVEISRFVDAECACLQRMNVPLEFVSVAEDSRNFTQRAPEHAAQH